MSTATAVYASMNALKVRVDASDAWTERDEESAGACLLAISRAVDKWCRVKRGEFAPTAAGVVRYFTAEWPDRLDVPALRSVSEIATDENNTGTYGRVWGPSDYLLGPDNAAEDDEPYTCIERDSRSSSGRWSFPVGVRRGVRVTGAWGWAETPPDVVEAVLLEAAHQIHQSQTPTAVVASAELGRYMVEPAWMPKTITLLMPYRRFDVRPVVARG